MFKKTLIRQDGFKDCGPTCLFKIIKHYKGYIDINSLKEMCKTTKEGTTAYHLIEAAKKCGFESYGIKATLKDLTEENLILPCIAHVTINNSYNHYIVIEKIDFRKKRILIFDPIGKTSYYYFDEFYKIFNNILIYLYPIKVIKNIPDNSFYKFIIKIIKFKNQIFSFICFIINYIITTFNIQFYY